MEDVAVYSEAAGSFVSSKFQHLAGIIQDYDPGLELRWIPSNVRTAADSKPYCIMHSPGLQKPYVVMYFDEMDNPEEILARIFYGDNKNANTLQKLEAREAAKKAMEYSESLAGLEEAHDQMHFLMTNRSGNWVKWKDKKTGEIVKLDSNRRRV